MRAALLVLLALALTACESSQEENAKLERIAKQEAKHRAPAQAGLSITKLSTRLEVLGTAVVSSSEGVAAVVTVRNTSATTLRDAPIAIKITGSADTTVYSNDTPGLASSLVSVALVPARGELTWVDDQVPTGSGLESVTAKLGEGRPATGPTPRLTVTGVELSDEGTSEPEAEGRVVNRSGAAQREVVVYAVARHGGKVVAAGSALLPEVPAGPGTRFQLYFIGSPRGARLQFSAVAAAA
jgi:hypothetical protein